jgi:hypothetical protein
MQYYYLISSLRDLHPDGAHKDFDALAIREYVRGLLTPGDGEVLDLFYAWYDAGNIVGVVRGGERWNDLGNFTAGELASELREPERLPDFLARVVAANNDPEGVRDVDLSHGFAHALYEAFYERTARSGNRFLREWYDFDRTLRNICAGAAARRLSRPVGEVLVGGGDAVASLTRTQGGDPGADVDFAERLAQTLALEDLWERERRLDVLRAQKADSLTAFDYFDMDRVLAYMVKVNLIHRWSVLDPVLGAGMLDRMLEKMKI